MHWMLHWEALSAAQASKILLVNSSTGTLCLDLKGAATSTNLFEGAWTALTTGELHSNYADTQAYELALILPTGSATPSSLCLADYGAVCSAQTAAIQTFSRSDATSSWTACKDIIRCALHAAYEDCKLITLHWNILKPLGKLLHALCIKSPMERNLLNCTYAKHYAQDLGLGQSLAAPVGQYCRVPSFAV